MASAYWFTIILSHVADDIRHLDRRLLQKCVVNYIKRFTSRFYLCR